MEKTSSTQKSIKAVKLPMLNTIFGAYVNIAINFRVWIIVGSIFALILSGLYWACGMETLCANPFYREEHFCNDNWAVFLTVRFISLALLCMFARIWGNIIKNPQTKFSYKMLMPRMADLKIMGLSLTYVLSLVVAIAAAYMLYVRVPNPNWKIELLYFAVVSLGFFVPFFALRFLSWFAFAAEDEKLPGWKIIWHKTADNNLLIILSIALIITIGLFLSITLLNNFLVSDTYTFYMAWCGEYLAHMVTLFMVACFMSYCRLQKIFLFERNDDGK